MSAILPFSASTFLPLPIEVQRLDCSHFVSSAGRHGHAFNEVVLFESSGDVHRVGEKETLTSVGMVDAIGEGQVHDVKLSERAAGWLLLFSDVAIERAMLPERLFAWFSRPGNSDTGQCVLSPRRRKRLTLYLSTLESAQQRKTSDDRREDGTPTLALFSAIVHELSAGHALELPSSTPYRNFERLLETIEERYMRYLTLTELADTVGLSKAFLTTDIRERTGRTAMQWVLDRRMREARRLLVESDLPITRLAHDLGFEDSSHFARRFRDVHDESPLKWRAAKRLLTNETEISYRRRRR